MDFKVVENKWQKIWDENKGLYHADDNSNKVKMYVLNEFPYPSGSGLHVGHTFSFTGGDVFARFKRMQGYNVLFPMGWDAFGLPTENYAIKMKRKPSEVTKENTDMFRSQMKKLAFSFDWNREVNTTDPQYYKWTQWIFVKLYEAGLAYKKEMPINWCPSCKIGLANEEVVDGKCERCGSQVSRRNISQWVVKITDYADRLIDGLEQTQFIDKVKMAQVNWIGKSIGAKINFKIKNKEETLEVFTTRPDTLPGVTFMVISPEHPLVLTIKNKEVEKYILDTRKKSDMDRTDLNKDKTGVFSGIIMINPLSGREIPLWVADYVLMSYGTGVVMGVPAHDERDLSFAKKYGLEIVPVIKKDGWNFDEKAYTEVGEKLSFEETNYMKRTASYHLRDWIFSRQHYWGEPIPMVDCPKCGWVSEKVENLPIVLPEVEAYEPTDDGLSPLSRIENFVNCKCPKCGNDAKRETDTMPNWAGSDWYFLRYCDPHNDIDIASQDLLKKWFPVDVYIGGDEHNTLHLLYSRFIHQFLYDLKVVPTPEPYAVRMSHGVILGTDNARMSKSKGNVIVPESVTDKYGVDVVRMYMMFMGPFDGTMAWNENTLMGVKRFIDRFNDYICKLSTSSDSSDGNKVIIAKLVDGVTKDLNKFGYNTAIAKMMKALNELTNNKEPISDEDVIVILKLMAPFAPYTAEELYCKFERGSVHGSVWPIAEKKYLIENVVMIPIAINGKVRDQIVMSDDVVDQAKELPNIIKWIAGKVVLKEIYIKGKMINFVTER
ncbi:MAG: leucine--tRNA ligase [Candidatus Shapirobacteria bacterium]